MLPSWLTVDQQHLKVSKKLFLSTKEMRPQPIFMSDKDSGRAFMRYLEAGRVLTFLRGSLMTLSTWL